MTSIGIIGAGNYRRSLRKGTGPQRHCSDDRQQPWPGKPVRIGERASATTGTIEAAARADIVLIAVPWSKLPTALSGLPDWEGRIVIDANNPIEAPLFKPAELNGRLSTDIVIGLVPGARVVKAFNHLSAALVEADPHAEGGARVLFYSGDDAAAKGEVAALIGRLGFAGVDLGPISIGGRLTQFPGGALPAINFVKFS
ncbi:NADP oxidoreductase [Rhizobium vallis]|uniref:NADP oxidoreductase n=1 Tax=Rhizobium vallis TaxID=634290 RepID=A0A432PHK9_9HYPH|nr:NAD(P)-binding domain-containing protein [Rhizobium vallis]RUM23869.1 NADP oxidoreductase [Rhizobium vallis]